MNNRQALFIITLIAIAIITIMAYIIFPLKVFGYYMIIIFVSIGIVLSAIGICVAIYEVYQFLGGN